MVVILQIMYVCFFQMTIMLVVYVVYKLVIATVEGSNVL